MNSSPELNHWLREHYWEISVSDYMASTNYITNPQNAGTVTQLKVGLCCSSKLFEKCPETL